VKYEDLNVGVKAPYKDCKQFFGKELTFKELVYEPGTEKLLILMLCTVNGIEEDDDIYVGQISRVVDCEEGYEEYADVILDIPGWDQKPISIDSDDMEYPELGEDDDPEVVTNCYVRVWRIKKPLTTLEHLAIGASVYSKCKKNMIDTTEDLLEAFRTGAIKHIFNGTVIKAIKTVLTNAKIEVPEEEQTSIAEAQPDEKERLLFEDLQRGTGTAGGKQRVADFYAKNRPTDVDFAAFLRKEYGCGGHSGPDMPDVGYDFKGIHMRTADGKRPYTYTWDQVAKKIRCMIEDGVYIERKQETAIVAAQPAELDPVDQAKQLHQRILTDAQSAAESLYDMCKAIKEMRDGKHYKALLYDNFEGYCEEALGMSRSHAYRYIQIAEGLSAENVSSMRQIGATKLALLASVTEEQREEIAQTVDLESTTVRELKAQVEAMKADAANKDKLLMQARESSQKSYEEVQERQEVINDLKARLKERTEQMNDMQAQITKLESRPVEVAVQDNSAELEQLRKEYEAKLAEQKKMMQELDDELGRKDDENYWSNVDRDLREVHSKIQSICVMVAGRLDCSEKETMKEKLRDLISDIEQRIGKE